MKKITNIYNSLNEEVVLEQDVNVNDLIKDEKMSLAAKEAALKKKWSINSNDIEEVINFKKKRLESELEKLDNKNESKVNEEGGDSEYDKFFKEKLKKWNISTPNELSDEDKKKFFDEIEKEWTKDNEGVELPEDVKKEIKSLKESKEDVDEKKKCKTKKKVNEEDDDEQEEDVDEKKKCKTKKVNEESTELIDLYTSKYFHFYESFSKVTTKEEIEDIITNKFPEIVSESDNKEARDAFDFFKRYREAELGIE